MTTKTKLKNSSGNTSGAYVRIAKSLRKIGELDLAVKVCRRGLLKSPENAALHIVTGQANIAQYGARGKPELLKSALINFEKALRLDPQNYIARLLAAKIYLKARSRKQAKAYVLRILKSLPDDERARALLRVIKEKERKSQAAKASSAAKAKPAAKRPSLDETQPVITPEETDITQWTLDDKLSLGGEDDAVDEAMMEVLDSKLTMFSRLEGLMAIFILDKNGQPFRMINRAKLDENVVPSLVFNVLNASSNAMRRSGFGVFTRSSLSSPVGNLVLANINSAILGMILSADANMANIEKRLDRYLTEVAG